MSARSSQHPRRRQSGVSLLELVVALAIFGIMAASLAVVMSNSFAALTITREADARTRAVSGCSETLLAIEERGGWAWTDDANAPVFDGCPDDTFATPAAFDTNWGGGATTPVGALLSGQCGAPIRVRCRFVDITDGGDPPIAIGRAVHFRIDDGPGALVDLTLPQ